MITLLGTSHISPDSLDKVRRALDSNPDCIGVELDLSRYLSKKEGGKKINVGLFLRIISKLQEYLGKKTDVFPGEEMFLALELVKQRNTDTYLIDQKYWKTIHSFQTLPLLEKIRIFITPVLGLNLNFSVEEIPEEEFVSKVLDKIKKQFPELYRELIVRRNEHMFRALKELNWRYDDILAVMGLGHLKGISKMMDKEGISYNIFK